MTINENDTVQQAQHELEIRSLNLVRYLRPKHSVSGEWVAVFADTEEAAEAITEFRKAEQRLADARAKQQ